MAVQPPSLVRRRISNGMVVPFGQPTSKPPAVFPNAVSTDSNLLIAQNQISTALVSPIGTTDTVITVVDPTAIVPNVVLTFDTGGEIVKVLSGVGSTFTIQRAFDNTVPQAQLAGAAVTGNIVAFHHNTMVAEVEAIEAALGPHLANVITVPTTCINFGVSPNLATICNDGTGDLLFNTANVERMEVTAAGGVQIGTASPGISGGQLLVATSITAYPLGLRGIVSAEYDNTPDAAVLFLVKSRGTPTAPLPAQAGDFCGYEGHYVTTTNGAIIPGAAVSSQIRSVGAGVATVNLQISTNPGQANPISRILITETGNVGLGNWPAGTLALPDAVARQVQVVVGSSTNQQAGLFLIANQPIVPSTGIGIIGFANYAITAANKVVAAIQSYTNIDVNTGNLSFWTASANVLSQAMYLGPLGAVSFPQLPSTAPAAGSKQIWYDPTDGNRVKFVP